MARLVHLTDIHFGSEIANAADAALAFARDAKPDLVLVTGDLTLNGLPREFKAAARWMAQLPEPRLATPGNHDTPYWNIPLRALVPFDRYRRYIGNPASAAYDGPGVSARALNTARGFQPRPDWSKGAINLDAARRAGESMAKAAQPCALRVVACHHPLVEASGAPVTGGVHRGELAAEILAEAGVDLILTGHVHNPFAVPLPFGDQRTYAVGGGTLSQRLRGTPASFNLIDADAKSVVVTAMGWSGSHFEPFRTWSLDRRLAATGERESAPGGPDAL